MRNRFKTFLSVLMVCLMVLGTPLSAMAADFSDGYAIAESTPSELASTQEEVTGNEDESSETLFNDAEESDFTDNEAVPEFSDEMAAPAADISGEYLGVKTEAKIYDDFTNDIWLQYQQKDMQVGDTSNLYPRRLEEAITNGIGNDVDRPLFHFEIIKGDSISLDTTESTEKAVVTAVKAGTTVVKVTYDAFEHKNGKHFDAISPVNTAYAVYTVGETGTAAIECSDNLKNWRHYDTIYYNEGETVPFTFTASAAGAENLKVTLNGLEIQGTDGSYTADLENRSNIIGIVATDAQGNQRSLYRVIDARFIKVNVANKDTEKTKIEAGDTAVISFTGITMPVYKLASIYNPCYYSTGTWPSESTYVSYSNDKLGSFAGRCTQYDLATNNSFEVEFTEAGSYTFTSENGIYTEWWGDVLGGDIVKSGSGEPNLNAPITSGWFSVLPDFTVTVDGEEPSHEHNWSTEWTEDADAHWHECTADGCDVTENAQKDGYAEHSWDDGVVTTEPTTESTGVKTYTCTVCHATKTEEVPKLAPQVTVAIIGDVKHDTSSVHVRGNETWYLGTVSSSSNIYSTLLNVFSANGMVPGANPMMIMGLTNKDGVSIGTGTNGSSSKWMCTLNGKLVNRPLAQTQVANGDVIVLFYTDDAAQVTDWTLHIHNWSTEWTTDANAHWHECTAENCDITENAQKDGYAEHTWDEGVVTTEPTTERAGVKTYTCTVCQTTKTEEIPELTPDPNPEEEIQVSLSIIGDKPHDSSQVHVNGSEYWYSGTVTVPQDSKVFTALEKVFRENGMTYTGSSNYISSVTNKDGITVGGLTNGQLSGWMYTLNGKHPNVGVGSQKIENNDVIIFYYTDDYTKADTDWTQHIHKWSTEWTADADAHWHECTVEDCDITENAQKDGYAEHTWDEGVVTTEPTADKAGVKTYTCTVCKAVKTEAISIPTPSPTPVPGKPVLKGTPKIQKATVSGNKVSVTLAKKLKDAEGYDFVVGKSSKCIQTKEYVQVQKNKKETKASFYYLAKGTYYVYVHAWTKDAKGKKVFSAWSKAYKIKVTSVTPATPKIKSVRVKGNTVTVTFTKCKNAVRYAVVLGTKTAKVNGEKYPVNYGKNIKTFNTKKNTVTVTFKNVKAGTYYAGIRAYNYTGKNNKKVSSRWSTVKTVRVK